MLIVPAVMFIVGRHIWWMPRALDRLVPTVDVEGEALAGHLARHTAVNTVKSTKEHIA